MRLKETKLADCYELENEIHCDIRGKFIKTFEENIFKKYSFVTSFSEEYYSVSQKHVIRGLHFQIPPYEQEKIVYCSAGEVLDVIVDLRRESPTYGVFDMIRLSSDKANMIYIPRGFAHGFEVLSDAATMMYKVTSVYSQEHDNGILWNSLNIPWQTKLPIMSQRDKNFIKFEEFITPFIFERNKQWQT